jgi:hypothetical protein
MTLDQALADAFARLAQGVADRRSPFHTPTLATIGADGAPTLRTLVLRGFDAASRSLRLHTDARSAKAAELAAEPRCALHGYDPAAGVQIRLAGRAALHADDAVAAAAWAASRPSSRQCYAIEPGPGAPVPAPPAAPRDAAAGQPHFRALMLHFHRLEWLDLDAAGHRRARFEWDEAGAPRATWLVP